MTGLLDLQQAIAREIASSSGKILHEATEELARRYRTIGQSKHGRLMESDAHRLAYINARMPATYQSNATVLAEIQKRMPDFSPRSLLDLGSGPGTVMWAAADHYDLQSVTLIEQDDKLIALGKRLSNHQPELAIANWLHQNLQSDFDYAPSDLVTISYALGEMDDKTRNHIVAKAWQATNTVIVLVEPGTPRGYEAVLKARDQLIALGGNIIAPCPHSLTCSMIAKPLTSNDWCHFSARVERSMSHKRAKDASLSFEDEKFSYVAFAKQQRQNAEARIVRHPLQKSGHTILTLCIEQEIKRDTVSRKQKDIYRAARKAEWGDDWEISLF